MREIREWLVGFCLNVEGIYVAGLNVVGGGIGVTNGNFVFIKANGWGFVISAGVGFMLFNIFS